MLISDINFHQLQPYLFLAIGLTVLFYSLIKKDKSSALKKTGEKSEGIVFDVQKKQNYSLDFTDASTHNSLVSDKVIVRFVTKEEQWITGEIKQPFAIFSTGQYKQGDKLNIYYDPEDPQSFYVTTGQSELLGRLLLAFTGIGLCVAGLYQIFG